jgi:hypothetical protein
MRFVAALALLLGLASLVSASNKPRFNQIKEVSKTVATGDDAQVFNIDGAIKIAPQAGRGFIELPEVDDPGDSSSGFQRLFIDTSTNTLKLMNSSGTASAVGAGFSGDLNGVPLTDGGGGNLEIEAAAAKNIVLKIGDADGTQKISFTDSDDAEVAYLNSDGKFVGKDATFALGTFSGGEHFKINGTDTSGGWPIYISISQSGTTGFRRGIYSEVKNGSSLTGDAAGIVGATTVRGSCNARAVYGLATGATSGKSIAIHGETYGGTGPRFGIYGEADAGGGTSNAGVFGRANFTDNYWGGFFQVGSTSDPVWTSYDPAAIVATNMTADIPIQRWYDNATEIGYFANGGALVLDNSGSASGVAGAGAFRYNTTTDYLQINNNNGGWENIQATTASKGSDSLTSSALTKQVTLSKTMPDTSYHVSLMCTSDSQGPIFWQVGNLTTTTMRVTASANLGTLNFTYKAEDY